MLLERSTIKSLAPGELEGHGDVDVGRIKALVVHYVTFGRVTLHN